MKTRGFYPKSALSLLTFSFLLSGVQQAQATLLNISQSPLILSESVAPNLILTLDDSGSMENAYAPDSINGQSATRRAKSAHFNPLYYDPTATYQVPLKIDSNGSKATTQYSTSFTVAYHNGTTTANGSLDLSTAYRPTWTYDPTSSTPTYANNPAADFVQFNNGGVVLSLTNGSTSANQTTNGVTYKVTRVSNSECQATISNPVGLQNVTCSRNSSTYTVIANDRTQRGVPAYYYAFDTSLTNCTTVVANRDSDDNCYRLVNVSSTSGVIRADDTASGRDERQNFAIWYSFYRNRALATLTAANLSFNGLPEQVRLTWQLLNRDGCKTLNTSGCGTNYLREFSGKHRGNFFNWLTGIGFGDSTPLRAAMDRAGKFLQNQNNQSSIAWAKTPNPFNADGSLGTTITTPVYACRPSYHIMMTDGLWRDGDSFTSTNADNTAITSLPDGKSYSPRTPYLGATQDTLADLAFKYWATDASSGTSGIANNLKPLILAPNSANPDAEYWDPRNDPATWQHLVNYTIGLGLNSMLTNPDIPWTGDTFGGAGYTALTRATNPVAWPVPADNSVNNVYDLWHAALNSRGEFFSADSPDKVVDAFRNIINRITNRTTSASAPGVTASIIEDQITREVYETQFNSANWSGNLIKYRVDAQSARTQAWDVTTRIARQSASSRNIKMFSSTNSNKLQDFSWTNLSSTQQALLNQDFDSTSGIATDSKGQSRVSYLRGDQTNEGGITGTFRERSTVLGDIINSAPVVVGTPKYLAYLADAIEGTSKYTAFRAANRTELQGSETQAPRRPVVYVGANDGMLHGFDANTGDEVFAFIPSAVIPNLYKLSAQKYKGGTGAQHQFYVDGSPIVADVYYDDNWHTVLIGTLRSGGRSMFALDITNPDDIKLLWERTFDDRAAGNSDNLNELGYTFPQPTIARLHTGKWAVVTGNGYGNQSDVTADKAALLILDVKTGTLVKKLTVTGDTSKANGLSTVKLADNNSDGVADYAYAGDLQGNMWRFDLVPSSVRDSTAVDPFKRYNAVANPTGIQDSATNADTFAVAYGGKPLFTALDDRTTGAEAQAIMAPPSLVRHPTTQGYLVIFGTGKYFETSDGNVNTTRAMSLYGIWDRKTKAQTTIAPNPTRTRSDLVTQTIDEQPTTNPFAANSNVQGIRLLSQNSIQWYKTGTTDPSNDSNVNKWGWLLDFKVGTTRSGEMMISPMSSRGQVLLLNTLTPNADPCAGGVDSWLYGIDPFTGGRTNFNVFDLDNSRTIDSGDSVRRNNIDTVVSSYKKPGSGGFTTNNGEIFTAPGLGGGMMYNAGPTSSGRQSWRVIPKDAQ
ncbi:pilus assembly protein [Zestomonas insulae]|nr:PilC/PilY family type IV pilus protein [Pseudomonas insulae]